MSQELRAIDFVVTASTMYEAEVFDRKPTEATLVVDVRRVDLRLVRYRVLISAHGTQISVKEVGSHRLPSFCPDRHINSDGSFCLYWSEEFAIHITDAEAANRWWETLHEFLRLQERADYAREWTGGGRAHGDAARYQLNALTAAATIDERLVTAIQRQQLTILKIETKNPANGMTLQLLLKGEPVCRVRQNKERITGQRNLRNFRIKHRRKSVRRLSKREEISDAYAKLTIALWNWKVAEDEYWNGYSDRKCCGTLDSCRLRNQENKRGVINV